MKRYMIFILILIGVTFSSYSAVSNNNTAAGFDKLKSLLGEWNGTLPDGKPIKITYQQISGGAIVEIYHSTDPMWWNMSSAYHRGINQIMMTHFCSWGNHPRMQAKIPNGKIQRLEFEFIDITETQPKNGYMRNVAVEFIDENHILHHWTWRDKDKDTPLTLKLARKI